MINNYFLKNFLENVSSNPNNIAIEIGKFSATYQDVFREATILVNEIKLLKVTEPIIGVLSYRSYASYIAIIASQLMNATFVPLNKNFPDSRNIEIIKLSGINCLVYDNECAAYFNLLYPNITQTVESFINFSSLSSQDSIDTKQETINYEDNKLLVSANSYAYIMFTSGSTGAPKGVPITYSNLFTFLEYCQSRYEINNSDRMSHTFELTFDLSVFDVFMTLSHGATLVVLNPLELLSPTSIIKNKKISVWFSVPSVAKLAFKKELLIENALPNLRLSLFCGEPLFIDLAKAWMKAAPNSRVENLYGPTEMTIACSHFDCSQINNEMIGHMVPIGELFSHLDYIILQDDMSESNLGEHGQLCISGGQAFLGYLNNEEKTNQSFINHKGKIYYLTGDVVKVYNGALQYIGRADSQIKINGYRIELSEIESCAKYIDIIIDVAALDYVDHVTNDKKIALFYVAKKPVNKDMIYEHLQLRLPKYMIPATLVDLENFPLNINGKIDRQKLRTYI